MKKLLTKLLQNGFEAKADNGNVTIKLFSSPFMGSMKAQRWVELLGTHGIVPLTPANEFFDFKGYATMSTEKVEGHVTLTRADAQKFADFSYEQLSDFRAGLFGGQSQVRYNQLVRSLKRLEKDPPLIVIKPAASFTEAETERSKTAREK